VQTKTKTEALIKIEEKNKRKEKIAEALFNSWKHGALHLTFGRSWL